ncbi:hypothetical protein CHE218_23890 [Microbacterium sp. che218]
MGQVAELVEASGRDAGPGPFDRLRDLGCGVRALRQAQGPGWGRWLSLSKPPGVTLGPGPFDRLRDLGGTGG